MPLSCTRDPMLALFHFAQIVSPALTLPPSSHFAADCCNQDSLPIAPEFSGDPCTMPLAYLSRLGDRLSSPSVTAGATAKT